MNETAHETTDLYAALVARLSESGCPDEVADLALAAWDGPAALEKALEAGDSATRARATVRARSTPTGRAYLTQIGVQGFRGIGPRAELKLPPNNGLTLILGRNGSGKSSFAEGLEMLLTGANRRWEGRSADWKNGWRNLHAEDGTVASLAASFVVEGSAGELMVQRTWSNDDLDAATLSLRDRSGERTMDDLGWSRALETYRPFLPYSELATWADKPSNLYDAVVAVLGLGRLDDVDKTLDAARKLRAKKVKDVAPATAQLTQALEASEDPRAAEVRGHIKPRSADIEAIEAVVAAGYAEQDDPALGALRSLAQWVSPRAEEVEKLADDLRVAAGLLGKAKEDAAEQSDGVAALLRRALAVYDDAPTERCPVCLTEDVLSPRWRAEASGRAESLEKASKGYRDAQDRVRRQVAAAKALVQVPAPRDLARLRELLGDGGVDVAEAAESLDASLTEWRGLMTVVASGDPDAIAEAMLAAHEPVERAAEHARGLARTELARRQNDWSRLARSVRAWIDEWLVAERAGAEAKRLKQARAAVQDAIAHVRSARFEPIAEQAKELWATLRAESNVALVDIALDGVGTRRRLKMDIAVDDVAGAALGVMSQGELHAMALSLFLPRAGLDASPFGFMIIDDPVQSMDAARVDGLARALEHASKSRQVVVFTHDDRLAEAVRRLGIDATAVRVERDPQSRVRTIEERGPIEWYIGDAMAIARERNIERDVAGRVIPGLCRLALDAAVCTALRRKELASGGTHADIDALLSRNGRLTRRAALLFFDDADRSNQDVSAEIRRRFGPEAANVFFESNRGAHSGEVPSNPRRFVEQARDLARCLERL